MNGVYSYKNIGMKATIEMKNYEFVSIDKVKEDVVNSFTSFLRCLSSSYDPSAENKSLSVSTYDLNGRKSRLTVMKSISVLADAFGEYIEELLNSTKKA